MKDTAVMSFALYALLLLLLLVLLTSDGISSCYCDCVFVLARLHVGRKTHKVVVNMGTLNFMEYVRI